MIELRDVHIAFGEHAVLQGVDLDVAHGTTCVVLGVSGAGKTVLLKAISGLIKPDRGSVRVDGDEVTSLDGDGLEPVRRKLGILFQSGALFDSMSVFDNVAFPLRERLRVPEPEVQRRVSAALKLVSLEGNDHKFPGELSGGMQKRVAFARAFVVEPPIMLFDEPTAGLDPITTVRVTEEIVAARKRLQATTLAITYNLMSAFKLADTIGLLHEGKLIELSQPEAFQRSQHPAVKAFLRDWNARRRAS